MKHIKKFNENLNIELPNNISRDIEKTGYVVNGLHKHGDYHILKLKRGVDMGYDPKDFSRFDWVKDNHQVNNNLEEFKLKIKF